MPSFDQVIVWMVVGLIGGSLAGLLVTWEKQGLGWSRNLGLGLAGALVGGFCFGCSACFQGWTASLSHCAISWRPSSGPSSCL